MIQLKAFQSLLMQGDFDTEQLWLATEKCENDLMKESWSVADVLQLLMTLEGPLDYYHIDHCTGVLPCSLSHSMEESS